VAKKLEPIKGAESCSPMTMNTSKSEQEWKDSLTNEQYHILREKGTERHLPDHISIIRKKESICVQRVVKSYLNHKQNTTLGQGGQVFGRQSTRITLNSIAIPDMVCDGPKLLVAIVAAISDTSSMPATN
jgi:hypothetical protein